MFSILASRALIRANALVPDKYSRCHQYHGHKHGSADAVQCVAVAEEVARGEERRERERDNICDNNLYRLVVDGGRVFSELVHHIKHMCHAAALFCPERDGRGYKLDSRVDKGRENNCRDKQQNVHEVKVGLNLGNADAQKRYSDNKFAERVNLKPLNRNGKKSADGTCEVFVKVALAHNVVADHPQVVKEQVVNRLRQQGEAVDEDNLHKAVSLQIGYLRKNHRQKEQVYSLVQKHSDSARQKVRLVFHQLL